jgi:hypothetical protein
MSEEAELLKKIIRQNELQISLLGRLAFSEEKLREFITKNAKKPSLMIKVYNLCDGENSINDIASKVGGITRQAIGYLVEKWEKNGIILRVEDGKNIYPIKLYKVSSGNNGKAKKE